MPTKYETFAELAARTEKLLTDSAESRKSFLVAAARLYKYPYHEQLLIYASVPTRLPARITRRGTNAWDGM